MSYTTPHYIQDMRFYEIEIIWQAVPISSEPQPTDIYYERMAILLYGSLLTKIQSWWDWQQCWKIFCYLTTGDVVLDMLDYFFAFRMYVPTL